MKSDHYHRLTLLVCWLLTLVWLDRPRCCGAAAEEQARAELKRLQILVPGWQPVKLTARPGEVALTAQQSLTIEQLRGVELDPNPPKLGERVAKYDPRQADDCPAAARPYVARDIRPFRFRYFQCEFNYGGWHNYDMQDYAATRGFNIVFPYARKREEIAHWPAGTQVLNWGGFVNWHEWLPAHGHGDGRYDQLLSLEVAKALHDAGLFKRDAQSKLAKDHAHLLMIDQEHPVLSPAKLREQPWFPKAAAEQASFEKRYYDGYALTYSASVEAARAAGWTNLSIYGWYPYGRTWGGLEKVEAEPGTDQAWNAFGRQILDTVDVVNNSVYCFYWSPQNVAYVLANIDMNLRMVNSAPRPKPVRPYFWTLLHGGGGGWRWWRELPLSDEETRAMIAMSFFTGFDGFDTWNWSGTGSHQTPAIRTKVTRSEAQPDGSKKQVTAWEYHDAQLGKEFRTRAANGVEELFKRYDVIHVLGVQDPPGLVRFQKIRPKEKNAGVTNSFPVFTMKAAELLPMLRPKSEPVAAMIEGMALVKPLEYLLRHGAVKIDVPAREQFGKTLPIVRRVQLGRWHVLITYDPKVVHGDAPRSITLTNFAGVTGRTLRLPADSQTRVFVLEAQP